MRPNLRGLIALLPLLALVTPLAAQDDSTAPTWEESVQAWKEHWAERLRQPDGWLSLAALLWLDDGTNTFRLESRQRLRAAPPGPAPAAASWSRTELPASSPPTPPSPTTAGR
ncbi:MAG: hypothetical protein R2991_10285 [Thermoanaerobaculia bacterium]